MVVIHEPRNNEKISAHFAVREFDCKCGQGHNTRIDSCLYEMAERLYTALECSKIIVVSGYRCAMHDKSVGGNGTGFHTLGQAMDFTAYDKNGNKIPSAIVACTLEDMGDCYGIGLNCGGNEYNTHMDTRPASRKWFGDENLSGSPSITKFGVTSFHDYCGIPKEETRNIKIGLRGADVRAMQSALIRKGFSCGKCGADGICGKATVAAIVNFQTANGLAPDGICGKLTRAKLFL